MTKDKFSELVLQSETILYRISMSMLRNENDCEDAVQAAILCAYEKLSTLKNEEYFRTWLVRILINECNKQLNRRKKIVNIDDSDNAADPSAPFPADNIELKIILEELPLKYKQVIVLYYIEEFSVKEIKKILSIPEGTVKSRLAKGRSLIQKQLSK